VPRKIDTNRKTASGPKLRQISNGIVHSKCSLKKKLARIVFLLRCNSFEQKFSRTPTGAHLYTGNFRHPPCACSACGFFRAKVCSSSGPHHSSQSQDIPHRRDTGMDQPLADPYPNFAFWNIWDGKLGCLEA